MNFILDNRTQTVVQVGVSVMLCIVMWIAWRTQKTYPGFGRWTASKIPHAMGWLLISLRGSIPDWASVLLANALLFITALLLYEGIRQFRGKPYRAVSHYVLMVLLLGTFIYFTWIRPNVNARVVIIAVSSALVIGRCAVNLFLDVPPELRPSFWFTATMFGLYDVVLILRVVTAGSLPTLLNPFSVDMWQSILFLTTIVVPIGWTFGFFMMTNDRLNLELGKAELELREMASTDFLTGALNRRAFLDLIQREYERAGRNGQSLVLLMIDIDQFKKFNDAYGHPGGDAMLCGIVSTCRANLRSTDLFVRWGGEEFATLLPNTNQAGGLQVAEKLRHAIETLCVPVDSLQTRATISIGGASWMPKNENWEVVLRRADGALYKAKQSGRNCVMME